MNEKELYLSPCVNVVTIHIEKSLLQASAQGYNNDANFDTRFFGLE